VTDRKKLTLRSPSGPTIAPDLKKRGRGWEISEKRLDALHGQAREMRRFSSDAHRALAERFASADLGRYTFKRHAVVGSAIVDFNCHRLGLAIAIDEAGANEIVARRRDKSLEAVGICVMRLKATDILKDMDRVFERITALMRMRIGDRREARRQHDERSAPPNNRPERTRPSGRSDGYGGGSAR